MKAPKTPKYNVNEQITTDPVRLVAQDGEQIGVTALDVALDRAREAKLDLVEISPQADPPVCKIMDYGKFRFEAQKKKKEAKKKQKTTQVKEIKLRVNIAEHDYQVKLKAARKFIENRDKVKVSLRFRGREITHDDLAKELFRRFYEDMKDIAKIEQESKIEGRQLLMVLAPN